VTIVILRVVPPLGCRQLDGGFFSKVEANASPKGNDRESVDV
jgi:hypothetical protein